MGRFDRYILSQLLRVFGFFALVLVGIYWVNRAVILLERYLSEGQSGGLVLQLTLLSLPGIIMIILPLASFVASAYTTNRLHSDSELVVVQATGFSTFRLARPFLIFGLIVALMMSLLGHFLVPASFRQLNRLEEQLAEAISARLLVPGTFQSPTRGVTVYVRDISPDGTLEGLLVTDRREVVRETTYSAHRALLVRHADGPRLVMFDGMAQTLEVASQRLSITQFEDFTVAIGTLASAPSRPRLDPRQLATWTLLEASPQVVERTRRDPAHLRRDGHLRFTQALLTIGATMVGYAALMIGGFSRFGLWRQVILAVLLVVLVKLVDNSAIDLAKSDPEFLWVVYVSSIMSLILCYLLLLIGNGDYRRWFGRRRPA